jgi:hypothetical protein
MLLFYAGDDAMLCYANAIYSITFYDDHFWRRFSARFFRRSASASEAGVVVVSAAAVLVLPFLPKKVEYRVHPPHSGTIASNQYHLVECKTVPYCTTSVIANKSRCAPPTKLFFLLELVPPVVEELELELELELLVEALAAWSRIPI